MTVSDIKELKERTEKVATISLITCFIQTLKSYDLSVKHSIEEIQKKSDINENEKQTVTALNEISEILNRILEKIDVYSKKIEDELKIEEKTDIFEIIKSAQNYISNNECKSSEERGFSLFLENIFSNLKISNTDDTHSTHKPSPVLIKPTLYLGFDGLREDEEKVYSEDYLNNHFIDQIKSIFSDFYDFLEKKILSNQASIPCINIGTWLTLLKIYFNRIPYVIRSNFKEFRDVSIYQYCRLVSALVSCLYMDQLMGIPINKNTPHDTNQNIPDSVLEKNKREVERKEKSIALLIGGDVSGIQDFVYMIPTKGAAKQLKTRSFLVQLLYDSISTYICEKIGIPPCNIILSGGGHVYILSPRWVAHCSENREPAFLDKTLEEISNNLIKSLKGHIVVVSDYTYVIPEDFIDGNSSGLWSNISKKLSIKKKKKFSGNFDYSEIFETKDKDEFPVQRYDLITEDTKEEFDKDIETLGKEIRNAKIILRKPVKSNDSIGGQKKQNIYMPLEFMRSLGYEYEFLHDYEKNLNDDALEIILLNEYNEDVKEIISKYKSKNITFRPLANYWPSLEDNIEFEKNNFNGRERKWDKDDERKKLTQYFSDIPVQFKDLKIVSKGPIKIAVVRADVDNAGDIFKFGLGEKSDLLRTATLSSALSEFFEGYVNYLAQQPKYKGSIGIVFTGGDDLFIVGAWNQVIDFTFELRDKFHRYTDGKLSFSGGIIVCDANLPVHLFSRMAEEAENQAKSYRRAGKEKDAIVIFDTEIGYDEKEELMDVKNKLLELNECPQEDVVFKGVLSKLYRVVNIYHQQKINERKLSTKGIKRQVLLDRWKWLLVYGLRKYTQNRSADKSGASRIITEIQDTLLKHSNRTYKIEDKLGAVLRWVEFLTRETSKNNNKR